MANASNVTAAGGEDLQAKVMNIIQLSIGSPTVVMNIFVLSIFVICKWMRSNGNIIICSMAVTDLMAGLTTITGFVRWTNWFSAPAGSMFCKIYYTVEVWAAMASIAHVLAVNGERYLAIVFPLKYKQIISATRIKIVLLCIWSVTLAEAIAFTAALVVGNQCLFEGAIHPILAFVIMVVSLPLPFIAVLAIYVHIVIVVVHKLRFMAGSSNLNEAALAQSQRKMFVTVSAILAAWIVCWMPLASVLVYNLGAHALNVDVNMGQFATMFYYAVLVSYGNSLLNPILYFLTSADFRKAGLQLFRCKSNEARANTSTSNPAAINTVSSNMALSNAVMSTATV